jgi:hypothetical protein
MSLEIALVFVYFQIIITDHMQKYLNDELITIADQTAELDL